MQRIIISMFSKSFSVNTLEQLTLPVILEDETINGYKCRHLAAVLDTEKMVEQRRQQILKIAAEFPEETWEKMAAEIRSLNISAEVWIGKDDYLLRQLKTVQIQPENDDLIKIVQFLSFDEPFDIEPPLNENGDLLPGWSMYPMEIAYSAEE